MAQMGFSYMGLIFLLMMFIPNLIWLGFKPVGYTTKGESGRLRTLERIGQVLTVITVLCFQDFNWHGWSLWAIWLFAAFAVMLLYECWWIRYFRSKRTLSDFYSSFLGIPVAGATLPVIGFFLLSIYSKVPLMLVPLMLLAVGHIGIHLGHARDLRPAGDDAKARGAL